jgi:uncharacterized protein YndB with AHSA1/START domain
LDIIHALITRATSDRVFQALTEAAHLAAWFAPDTQAEPRIGSIADFRFHRGTIRVEITELEPERKIVWKVLQGMPGWEQVTGDVTWELEPNPFGAGTMIRLTHRGWLTMEGAYASVNFRWAWFITRMQSYLETGGASPARLGQ